MKKRARIDLNPAQSGLNAAFAQLGGLPEVADLPPFEETKAGAPCPAEAPTRRPGRVVLRRETAHRGGKAVIVVHDFAEHIGEEEIDGIARALRTACGCGGTQRNREIELQGEPIARIRALLEARGFQVAGVRPE